MRKIPRDIIVGIITGTAAGLCVLFGQFFAEIYDQKYNLPIVALVAMFAVVIVLLVISKKAKQSSRNEHIEKFKKLKFIKYKISKQAMTLKNLVSFWIIVAFSVIINYFPLKGFGVNWPLLLIIILIYILLLCLDKIFDTIDKKLSYLQKFFIYVPMTILFFSYLLYPGYYGFLYQNIFTIPIFPLICSYYLL